MAAISQLFPFRHLRGDPNAHVLYYRGGKLGLTFRPIGIRSLSAELPDLAGSR